MLLAEVVKIGDPSIRPVGSPDRFTTETTSRAKGSPIKGVLKGEPPDDSCGFQQLHLLEQCQYCRGISLTSPYTSRELADASIADVVIV